MKRELKIIHLTLIRDYIKGYHPPKDSDLYPLASWAGLIATRMKKRHPYLDVEVWRADKVMKETSHKKIFDMDTLFFPVEKITIGNCLTLTMYRRLLRLSKKYEVVIYHHNIYDAMSIFGPIILPKVKFIPLHHGGLPPRSTVDNVKNKIKDFFIRSFYKKNHRITYQNWVAKDYLKEFCNPEQLKFWIVGADYKKFTELGDRAALRKKYGLSTDKVYGLYVGPYSRVKSVELILDAYQQLIGRYDFSIIFVGGKSSDEFSEEIKELGLIDLGRVDWDEMPSIYNCADFYIHPVFNFSRVGFDVSLMEAMAANIPVASTLLPILEEELSMDVNILGKPISKRDEVVESVEYMIKNHGSFHDVRAYQRVF